MEPGVHQPGVPLDAGVPMVTGPVAGHVRPATPRSESMLDPAASDGNPTESASFARPLAIGFVPTPIGHDVHQLLDGFGEALGPEAPDHDHQGRDSPSLSGSSRDSPARDRAVAAPGKDAQDAGPPGLELPEHGVLGAAPRDVMAKGPLGSGALKPPTLGAGALGAGKRGPGTPRADAPGSAGLGMPRPDALGSTGLGAEALKAGEMFLGPQGLPTAAINVSEAPGRRQRPAPPGQSDRAPGDRPPTDRPPKDRAATDRAHGGHAPADRPAKDRPHTDRSPADRGHADRSHADRGHPTGRAAVERPPADRSSERTPSSPERVSTARPTNDRIISRRPADWPANDRVASTRPPRPEAAPEPTTSDGPHEEQPDRAANTPREDTQDQTGAGDGQAVAPEAGAAPKTGRRPGVVPRGTVRNVQPDDDRYAAPRERQERREKLIAPATDDSPDVRPPPSYSALVGGAVPGDPTSTYSALWGSRLRAMLPWQSTEDPIAPILRMHRQIHPTADVALLRRAYAMAEQMHRGQMRKSGEAFISHPIEVTEILADLGMDTTTLVAALLHDTVEDTEYTLGALERDFGGEVALLVDGVTKFDKMFYGADAEAETIRKMIVAAGRDVRVLVIKLADRLHNMRTLDARSVSSQVRIATATREVLIPLCERLGIQALKRELEDWVLRAVSPSGYAVVDDYVRQRVGWDSYLDKITSALTSDLKKFSLDATVSPRPRHLYSIWKDTVDGNYGEPHDLPRVVIIVDGADTDCYAALGAVHGKWRPVPGRFKDFIATPKGNNYKSLHTTVLGPEGQSLEVLIRTVEMHQAAEYGIVANFRYPHTAAKFGPASKAEQLDWLRRLLDWEAAASDPAQFIASLRCDLAEDQILVLTAARGDVSGRPVLLPSDATPVDLAYILGADVGNRCIGARVNGRLIAVSSPLADGDTVEIITRAGQKDEFDFDADAPARGPSPEWLEFVKTPHARLHISRWFEAHETPAITVANKVRLGRLAIGLALRQQGRGLASDLPLVRLAPRLGYPDLETLLVAVADHARTAEEVVAELIALVDHSPR